MYRQAENDGAERDFWSLSLLQHKVGYTFYLSQGRFIWPLPQAIYFHISLFLPAEYFLVFNNILAVKIKGCYFHPLLDGHGELIQSLLAAVFYVLEGCCYAMTWSCVPWIQNLAAPSFFHGNVSQCCFSSCPLHSFQLPQLSFYLFTNLFLYFEDKAVSQLHPVAKSTRVMSCALRAILALGYMQNPLGT